MERMLLPAEIWLEIDDFAPGTHSRRSYAGCTSALTANQFELIQRDREGLPMSGGSVATNRLRRDVEPLLSLRLIEPAGTCPCGLAPIGAHVFEIAQAHQLSI